MPYCRNAEGAQLWYEEKGSGRTIILLHGWSMSSAVWSFQLESLSKHFRVIAPDLRGHGRSEKSPSGYSFDAFGADIAGLLDQLDISDACLLGWSLGAEAALKIALLARERLAGLVLVSGTPRFSACDDFPHALSAAEADGMAIKVRRNIGRALEGFTARMFAPAELDDTQLAIAVARVLQEVRYPGTDVSLESLKALAGSDLRCLLPEIDLPTLVINGSADTICLPAASDFLAATIRLSSHVVLPGCGHAPFLTRASEFDACIIDFCRRNLEFSK